MDHIYSNFPQKVVKSGICLPGITDHLSMSVDNKLPTYDEKKNFRDFSRFKDEQFITESLTI